VLGLVAETARKLGRQVRATMNDPEGQWPLVIHGDGTVEPDATAEAKPRTVLGVVDERPTTPVESVDDATQASASAAAPAPAEEVELETAHGWVRSADGSAPATSAPFPTRRERRKSFLTQQQSEEPATQGWRGLMTHLGMRLSPSEAERAERADVQAVSQHWPGPRTIAIVNGKGGAGKTPTTVLLSAVFARYGGAGVLAWDNNQTRGTLGWRTEQGPHEATLLELLPQVDRLLSTSAQSADLAH
ncbi:ParA family protein, partial [Tsukamurella conjunctivitidis]|uniref:ParA family protein n=1 Tax=Tsukamurella conjunctivitidis TaxID=2592068 RepID=UPI002F3FCBDE